MILLVTGGRLYSMQPYDWLRLDALGSTALYEGEADGADLCALGWARIRGIPVRRFPADWDAHGKAAGPMRNAAMLEAAREEAQQTLPAPHWSAYRHLRAPRHAGAVHAGPR